MLQMEFRYNFQLIKTGGLILLLFIGTISAFAQQLDLDNYLLLLQKNNLMLQRSANQMTVSHLEVRSARADFLPTVATEFSYQRDFTKNFLFLNEEDASGFFPDKFRTNFNNNLNASILAEQAVFNPTATYNYKLAQLAAEQARLTHQDFSQELIAQGAQLFWQALYARENIKILENNKVLAEEQYRQMTDLFEQGHVSELEVRRSESFFKRTIPGLQHARNTYAILLNELRALANLPMNYPLDILGEIRLQNPELDDIITTDTSLSQNPQLRMLLQQARMSELQIKVANAARYPVLKVNLGYLFNAQDNAFRFSNNNNLLFGQLTFQLPIFTGGYHTAQVQKSIIQQRDGALEIRRKRLELQKDLANARLNLQNALETIAVEKEAIHISEKELAIAGESQKLGLLTALEFKEMRLGRMEAELRLLHAHLDLRIAYLQLNRILGKNQHQL